MRSRISLAILFIVITSILSGCWNYVDIETVAIVTGVAIDKNEDTNQFILTIELINQKSGELQPDRKSIVIETEGYTIFDAVRNAIMKTGKKLFWGHCKVIIISEAIARDGIVTAIDWAVRDAETRPDIWVLVSRANTAKEILDITTQSNEIKSFLLDEAINSIDGISKFISEDFTVLAEGLEIKTTSKALPTVILDDKDKLPEISGSAVMKDDKVVYFLDENESKIALLIRNQLNGGLLTLSEQDSTDQIRITLEIFKSKTKLKPVIQENNIYIYIDTQIDVGIAEIEGRENFIEKSKRQVIADHMGTIIEEQMMDLVKKTQDNDSTDIFDFSGTIQRKMPTYWKEIESDWDEVYAIVKVIPNVEINIIGSAFSSETIKKGE